MVDSRKGKSAPSGSMRQQLKPTASTGRSDSDEEPLIKSIPKKEKVSGQIKLKRPAPKPKDPGNWMDAHMLEDRKKTKGTDSPSTNSVASPGPVVNPLDDRVRQTFATGRPLEDSPEARKCTHCKKSVSAVALQAHVDKCVKLKKEKAERKKEAKAAREKAREKEEREEKARLDGEGDTKMDDDDDDDAPNDKKTSISKGGKKTAGKATAGAGGKKRKADGEAEKAPKQKKKKEEPKPKVPKPKGPVDVERQCGVTTPSGAPCARSLTCKSHSMGAKRAVPGRSLPYDMLLAAYQKKNQAKQQKAAIDANAPIPSEDEAENGPIDSDEEKEAVMNALRHWHPIPLVPQPVLMSTKRKYQRMRLKEQLDNAFSGGVNPFAVIGYGVQRLDEGHPGLVPPPGEEDAEGEPEVPQRKTSVILPPGMNLNRKSSFKGVAQAT